MSIFAVIALTGALSQTIHLSTKGDDIAFDKSAISAPAGKDLALTFANDAKMDSEILHNVAVLKPGKADEVIKILQGNGYEIEKLRGSPLVIAMTKQLAPGTAEILKVPALEPGEYPFLCLMAGHADMLGMKGVLSIAKAP